MRRDIDSTASCLRGCNQLSVATKFRNDAFQLIITKKQSAIMTRERNGMGLIYIIWIIKSRRMRLVGNVARMG